MIAAPLAAQGDPYCLWCVTPTKCDEVDETAASECTERVGGECSTNGFCFIVEEEQEIESTQHTMFSQLIESGLETILVDTPIFGTLAFVEIGGGDYGLFDCQGNLSMVATSGEDGVGHLTEPTAAQRSLSLEQLWRDSVGFARAAMSSP